MVAGKLPRRHDNANRLGRIYSVQRSLVFPQLAGHVAAAAAGLPEAEELTLRTADGERLIAWYVAPRQDKPLFISFHGNGDTLDWRVDRDRKLVADGTGLLAISYRGYEGPGSGCRAVLPKEIGIVSSCPPCITSTDGTTCPMRRSERN